MTPKPSFVTRGDTCVWLLDVPYPQTFMAWLRQQCDFPGRIHDLARDVVADPDTAPLETARQLRQYLERRGACDAALDTLTEAIKVWNVTYGAALMNGGGRPESRRTTWGPMPP
jgi:hypothetical protein